MTIRRRQPGDPLSIRASEWNQLADMARDAQQRMMAARPAGPAAGESTDTIFVRNTTASDVARFAVLGIDAPLILPADNEEEFHRQVAVDGVAPTVAAHAGRFVIAAEPIAAGAIGRGFLRGLCTATVNIQAEDDEYADLADVSGSVVLASGAQGCAQILWAAAGTGNQLAILRMGPFAPRPFLARVTGVHDNYLECKREVSGALTGDAFNVAKYPEVQRGEYDGETLTDPTDGAVTWTFAYTGSQTRTVTDQDSATEDQVIVPRYIPASGDWLGSRIVAVPLSSVVLDDDESTEVTCPYLELTNRAFAKVAE